MPYEIRLLRAEDSDVLTTVSTDVFDHPIDPAATTEFLADPRHHLAVATDEGVVVGFASAVHYVHPDKPSPELWVNEVAVASTHQGRGIGKALMRALLDLARQRGCREAWVLTDHDNDAALRLYESAGGTATRDHVMFTFHLDRSSPEKT